jgi:predicted nucleic acid-binding protein
VIVVDASVLVDVLLRAPGAALLESRLFNSGMTLNAPHLLDVEVAHVVRQHAGNGELDSERGRAVLVNLAEFPLRRHPHLSLLQRVWSLRHNIRAYDAVYIALTEALDATLLTRDQRLANAAGHNARIEVV